MASIASFSHDAFFRKLSSEAVDLSIWEYIFFHSGIEGESVFEGVSIETTPIPIKAQMFGFEDKDEIVGVPQGYFQATGVIEENFFKNLVMKGKKDTRSKYGIAAISGWENLPCSYFRDLREIAPSNMALYLLPGSLSAITPTMTLYLFSKDTFTYSVDIAIKPLVKNILIETNGNDTITGIDNKHPDFFLKEAGIEKGMIHRMVLTCEEGGVTHPYTLYTQKEIRVYGKCAGGNGALGYINATGTIAALKSAIEQCLNSNAASQVVILMPIGFIRHLTSLEYKNLQTIVNIYEDTKLFFMRWAMPVHQLTRPISARIFILIWR